MRLGKWKTKVEMAGLKNLFKVDEQYLKGMSSRNRKKFQQRPIKDLKDTSGPSVEAPSEMVSVEG